MTDFVIRTARYDDAEKIAILYSNVWSSFSDSFPEELLRARTPSPDEMTTWLESDTYFVVEMGERIIGVVGCASKHGTCNLIHMVVDENYRKHGFGQALVNVVIQEAQKLGASKVWLDTLPFLREAISLYEKNGFTKCGHLKKHLWNLDLELYELVFE